MTSEFTIAVHALCVLNHQNKIFTSEKLADNICTNATRVRKIMAKLKKAGIVETKEGVEGGYLFTKSSKETTLAMIAKALDFSFVSCGWKSGDEQNECLIASGMGNLMGEIYDDLNECCMERLQIITLADLETEIFKMK